MAYFSWHLTRCCICLYCITVVIPLNHLGMWMQRAQTQQCVLVWSGKWLRGSFLFVLAGELGFINTAEQAQMSFPLHSKSHSIGVQSHRTKMSLAYMQKYFYGFQSMENYGQNSEGSSSNAPCWNVLHKTSCILTGPLNTQSADSDYLLLQSCLVIASVWQFYLFLYKPLCCYKHV